MSMSEFIKPFQNIHNQGIKPKKVIKNIIFNVNVRIHKTFPKYHLIVNKIYMF